MRWWVCGRGRLGVQKPRGLTTGEVCSAHPRALSFLSGCPDMIRVPPQHHPRRRALPGPRCNPRPHRSALGPRCSCFPHPVNQFAVPVSKLLLLQCMFSNSKVFSRITSLRSLVSTCRCHDIFEGIHPLEEEGLSSAVTSPPCTRTPPCANTVGGGGVLRAVTCHKLQNFLHFPCCPSTEGGA